MANTYTQIYIHIVFAVQGRQNLLRHEYNDELQKYMTGIISGQGQKLPFTAQYGHQVHSKSARASLTQELQRRIHRAVETLQRAARPTTHFPTRGARLDAAPTELLLYRGSATTKISLLRSMFPVL